MVGQDLLEEDAQGADRHVGGHHPHRLGQPWEGELAGGRSDVLVGDHEKRQGLAVHQPPAQCLLLCGLEPRLVHANPLLRRATRLAWLLSGVTSTRPWSWCRATGQIRENLLENQHSRSPSAAGSTPPLSSSGRSRPRVSSAPCASPPCERKQGRQVSLRVNFFWQPLDTAGCHNASHSSSEPQQRSAPLLPLLVGRRIQVWTGKELPDDRVLPCSISADANNVGSSLPGRRRDPGQAFYTPSRPVEKHTGGRRCWPRGRS